jgi:hypothetical protein
MTQMPRMAGIVCHVLEARIQFDIGDPRPGSFHCSVCRRHRTAGPPMTMTSVILWFNTL